MSAHHFEPTILRAYDIRGEVGRTLSAADARALGRAFAAWTADQLGATPTVCVGRDGRLSSPELEAALVDGLRAAGAQVRRIGCGPTPMLYYAVKSGLGAAGIQVTGSHNPPDHNGFKMLLASRPVFGPDIVELGRRAAAGVADRPGGQVEERAVFGPYVERLLADWDGGDKAFTVVWDAGNGAAGDVMAALAERLPGRHVLLNETIDGTFPAHHPDPTDPETLAQLIAAVKAEGACLGIAFDGDGDRLGVVDGTGRILWGDQLLQVLAEDVLKVHPGAPIIADVKASQVLFDEIARLGGQPVMAPTGHSLIKTRMAEIDAPLAGEMSGHLFFADRYLGIDDALYAAIRLLGVLARLDETPAERFARLPSPVNTPELRIDCPDETKFEVVEAVRQRLRAAGAEMVEIDGVRVREADLDGWWLLRASNTQAVLVARAEAADPGRLAKVRQRLAGYLEGLGLTLPG
ncbi:phosphoglucomutase/phosphomannomutase PgmG [Roseospirillum parvum]|uniref:Phosphomannomutase n=1 Tax=Roseospirillum parvum TaxID=83401 RepID=A0A1G7VAM1_9PROT|nr:phosphomannomutase/phosphoglucomutase [Roseospirillum parvum]SDG56389.1 phosphomannomutase [Roseospirillum parvum]